MTPVVLLAFLLLAVSAPVPAAPLDEARMAVRQRDYSSAAAIYRRLANAGDPEAMYQLSTLYRSGLGVKADPAQSRALLELAAGQGHVDAEYAWGQLLEKGSGLAADSVAAQGWYRKAADKGHVLATARLKALVGSGASGGALTADDLVFAAGRGDVVAIRTAAVRLRDPDIVGTRGRTALVEAIVGAQSGAVDALIELGADINLPDSVGNQPLHLAVQSKSAPVVRSLLKAGASVDTLDSAGNTPLIIASLNGDLAIVTLLLDARAGINVEDQRGWTALQAARERSHRDVEALLVKRGARAGSGTQTVAIAARSDVPSSSALIRAAWDGDAESVRRLLAAGVDPNGRTDGETPLTRAVAGGHVSAVRLLLAAAAACIARLHRSSALRGKLAAGGRKLIEERYSCERSVAQWSAVLSQIAAAPPMTRVAGPSEPEAASSGRLDRVLGVAWGETMRGALGRRFVAASAGSEWPHSYGTTPLDDPDFWRLAAALDGRGTARHDS